MAEFRTNPQESNIFAKMEKSKKKKEIRKIETAQTPQNYRNDN
jgi:hypothetical protein